MLKQAVAVLGQQGRAERRARELKARSEKGARSKRQNVARAATVAAQASAAAGAEFRRTFAELCAETGAAGGGDDPSPAWTRVERTSLALTAEWVAQAPSPPTPSVELDKKLAAVRGAARSGGEAQAAAEALVVKEHALTAEAKQADQERERLWGLLIRQAQQHEAQIGGLKRDMYRHFRAFRALLAEAAEEADRGNRAAVQQAALEVDTEWHQHQNLTNILKELQARQRISLC